MTSTSSGTRRSRIAIGLAAAVASGAVVLTPVAAHAAPMAVNDDYVAKAGVTFETPVGRGALANDVGADQTHSFRITSAPTHGVVDVIGAGGSFHYRATDGYLGLDTFEYCVTAVADTAPCLSPTAQVTIQVGPTLERVSGIDRYEGSAAVSARTFTPDRAVVYLASGEVFPDALSAAAVAGVSGAPVLLMTKESLPGVVAAELTRLNPDKIIIVGGMSTISDDAKAGLAGYAPVVERIAGLDRYSGSAAMSASIFAPNSAVAYIASGEVFPDALAGAPASAHQGGPVLLVQRETVSSAVESELLRLKPKKIVVLGGANSVSDTVIARIKTVTGNSTPVSRVSGLDRYEVSASISAGTFAIADTHTVYVASGQVFPDALSGAAAAINDQAPVLLVNADSIPGPVASELFRLNPTRIVVLGGPNTVSDAVLAQLQGYLRTS